MILIGGVFGVLGALLVVVLFVMLVSCGLMFALWLFGCCCCIFIDGCLAVGFGLI